MGARAMVFFVGAGPGDPRLLTLRASELLGSCDAVLLDDTLPPGFVDGCGERCERVTVPRERSDARALGEQLVEHVRAGRHVVRLCAGDPLFFSTADEEVAHVARAGVPFEIVPGIVTPVAAGAYAAVPLTRGTDVSASVALASVSTGLVGLHAWDKLGSATDTLALDCDADALGEVVASLIGEGRSPATPAAAVADVTTGAQTRVTGTLADIVTRARAMRRPRVVLAVGEHVARGEVLRWFDTRPLFGKRVLVTRAAGQAPSTAALLRDRGAEPVVEPTIRIAAPEDPTPLQHALAALPTRYDYVVFTSANGVDWTWRELARTGRDARLFAGVVLAVIGPGTAAALQTHGLGADVVAREYKGEGLADVLLEHAAHGERPHPPRALVARAAKAREALPEALRQAGWQVDVVAAYETHPPAETDRTRLVGRFEAGSLDAVVFTSSSTVDNLCDLLGSRAVDLLGRCRVASIGPITTSAAERRGVRVDVTASVYTVEGVVDALEAIYAQS